MTGVSLGGVIEIVIIVSSHKWRLSVAVLSAESLELQMKITYQSVFVGYVVGEFEFVEGDNFLHPLFSSCGTVGVNVHPLGHLRVRLARHDPSAVVELVAKVVSSHHVQQQDVLCLGV